MTEEQVKQNNEIDPFEQDCSDIDTSLPRLQPDRTYRFEIRSAKVEPVKKKPSDKTLAIKLETTTDAMDTNGGNIFAGFPVWHRISITPTEERTVAQIAKRIAELVQATDLIKGGTKVTPGGIIANPSQLEGKLIDAKVRIEPEKDGFPEKNAVAKFIPVS